VTLEPSELHALSVQYDELFFSVITLNTKLRSYRKETQRSTPVVTSAVVDFMRHLEALQLYRTTRTNILTTILR
jgi:hypothetical protein